jgi:hypothetical protein
MSLQKFIQLNNIQQVDAIILRKKVLGMVDHYAIFLGFRNTQPVFVANFRDGVKELTIDEIRNFLHEYEPTSIEKFRGSEFERRLAIQRAMSRIGEKAYDFIANNCEHFKTWVHTGEHRSEQVKTVGNVALGVGAGTALLALATKSPKAGAFAVGLLLLGAILKDFAEE